VTTGRREKTALELAQEGEAIAAKLGTGPPFSADTPWPARYVAEMAETIRRAAEVPPLALDRIKLTREQLAAIPHADPSPLWAAASNHVPLSIPVELVDDITLSTLYELGQAKIRAAVGGGPCIVACAFTDEERVTDAVAGLPGVEVRTVLFLDAGDVIVLDETAAARSFPRIAWRTS
jgi:hypothetical protein